MEVTAPTGDESGVPEPPVVTPFGITTPASPTLTRASLCRSGCNSVMDFMNKTMRPRQASRHLDYSGGPSVRDIDLEAGDRPIGTSAGDGQTELPHSSRHAVIPKVRAQLRRVAGDLFTPHTVRIGPYNRDCYNWLWAEEKKKAVHDLQLQGGGADLKQVVNGVQPDARKCYTHLPDDDDYAMDSEKFCSMLLHDACYLVSLLLEYGGQQMTVDNTVVRDTLYLLENQIPLFVIDKILEHVGAEEQESSAAVCFAKPVMTLLKEQLYISETSRVAPSASSHLLDLVHFYLAGSQPRDEDVEGPRRTRTGRWRRATEYRRYADLQFKPGAFGVGKEWTILDVRLDGGSLWIPLLCVDNNTWTLLRNLMALEEHKEARPVTAYCLFMSQLACTAEDVQLLRSARVIEHFLGSDESAAQGFADLCHGVALDIDIIRRNYLKPIWHRLEKRCGVPVHNFKGFFREKYFSNVFYRSVFFMAFILFSSEVLQAIYAIIAYHKPNNSAARQ